MALGDGNLSNPNGRAVRLRVSCDLKYPFLIGKIKRALIQAFPTNSVAIVKRRNDRALDVSCFSNKFEALLGWRAKGGPKFIQRVRVPEWILRSKACTISCLCGLIETDGSVYTDRGYRMMIFTSVIPELSQDVYDMIVSLGFSPRVYEIFPKSKFNSQPVYHIRLSRNVKEFLNLVQPQKI